MNNGEMGKVIFVSPQSISMPIVSVNGKYIDLSQNSQLKIVEMMYTISARESAGAAGKCRII